MIVLPTPTYTLIQEHTLSAAQTSVTLSSIPSTYKDLVVECFYASTGTLANFSWQFNGDTGTNYSITWLDGNGSSVGSYREVNRSSGILGAEYPESAGYAIGHIFSYSNTNIYKTAICRHGVAGKNLAMWANLWRSTAAISSITILWAATANTNGVTVRLWGIVG